ncbi:corticotropin-releasing factor receptor 2-like [Mya arenaria]|uniref:corticotropin-releasing factor receptor 2-like n=1 Tax=Mya arenaria TaxID=6604 RepID=UPI0022E5A3CA|nr:corticotropin-releasing factor receptor 2-like [Mya arenaria]XP_052804001.1 corticotropin-releasing factor receptor 2-like [Mya arenaria]XP_052804011.1 corticotropin-releasing factor receptor 2-like [Mya arenaria]XP_052804019.1 corticotropin-releasing factor receptor 2-like [Mya arenaria]XP_052804024.1 corticotropin-releasing factor receptor 2-like [Mya arenaria]XP_052804032.1 corticotropin-releasing factor receptor 2-like [Mya arenaria]XP_052804039.1 corticotropin-releasing factor recepto
MSFSDNEYREQIMLRKLCLLQQQNISLVEDGEGMYCNSSWDNVSCWPRTPAGSHASIPCPSYLVGINEANNATKYCNSNGTWASKAIYDLCIPEEEPLPMDQEVNHLMAIRVIYNVGFSVSTLALVVALYIFLYFRSLRCLRNSIHCHLIVTFIVKNILWIIMRHVLTYLQQPAHAWVCKTLISLFNFATATNFFWMFVEGLYLHVIIVWTFSADKIRLSYLLLIGWGMPALNIVAWVIVKSRLEEKGENCWLPNAEGSTHYDFVFIGPILFVLCLNIVFLSTIVWVLITKLRASHTLEIRQYRKAVKATIILFPLLGITYVLFIISPSDHPQVKLVFNIINAVLQSFQGLLVAVFYCFLNGEVKGVLKKRISRFNDARTLSTKFTRASYGGWTRNSEYGHTSVSHAGNGSVVDPVRSTAVKSFPPESIPLTDTNVDSDQIECL